MRHETPVTQVGREPTLEVIAPADIRNSVAVPLPDETEEERKRRDDVFFAVLDAGGFLE